MHHPILDEIARYCDAAGIQETTFGGMSVKDSRFVKRVREGKVTLQRIERARKWMAENPPKGQAA